MRQIGLTFMGEPRTEAAKHAPESVPSMTVPLLILAVFAICLGWVGIPEPVSGGIIPNWFHDFVISTIETGSHGEAEHALRVAGHLSESEHAFSWAPMIIGTIFGIAGLVVGGLAYWRNPVKAGEMDHVKALMHKMKLGGVHDFMRNRFYMDTLYQKTIVRWSIGLADLFDKFDYGQPVQEMVDGHLEVVKRPHGVVDGIVNGFGSIGKYLSKAANWFDSTIVDGAVNLVGRVGRLVSMGVDWFDLKIVDGIVNAVGAMVKYIGGWIRPIQTGKVQNYLLLACLMVLALIAAFFVILLTSI